LEGERRILVIKIKKREMFKKKDRGKIEKEKGRYSGRWKGGKMIMCSNLYIPADLNQGLRSVDK
jgi:hypothetical protein